MRDKVERLDRKEQEAMDEMQTADELLQGAKVTCLMVETAKSNQAKAKRKLKAVREKQKEVNTNKQKLLEKALTADVLLYYPRKESQSKCELSFYTSQQVLCQLSKD